MSFVITRDCISCAACETECPNEAIEEGETRYYIDPDRCTECYCSFDSPQCADICPVDACQPDPENEETGKALFQKWHMLHPAEQPIEGTY